MVIRRDSPEYRIARAIRGHEKRIEDLEEDREADVEATLIRRVSVEAVASVVVAVTTDDDPQAVYNESKYNFSEYK